MTDDELRKLARSTPTDFEDELVALLQKVRDRTRKECAGLRLKPLEWNQIRPADHEDGEWWTASTVFGSFDVEYDPGNGYRWRYCFDEYYDEGNHDCESIENGKQQAEAYYRERISPAFEVPS